jgi:cytochrome c oxidase assembly factor CtaG
MKALTPIERDRGLQRLRRLTFGVAAGALMAVLGISYVAAASYAGKSTSTLTSTASTASQSSTSSDLQSSAQAPSTGSSGTGTVTTGGS